ncbi:VOC family protein [Paenibacillus tarimensis]
MSEIKKELKKPLIDGLVKLNLPAADPYVTGKWYCDMFDLDPNASNHSPLKKDHNGKVVLQTRSGMELFFIQSEEKLPLCYTNADGYDHTILLFQVKEISEIFERMKEKGVKFYPEEINDRGSCGREFAFIDPDGRKIEISDYDTEDWYSIGPLKPKLGDLITLYLPVHHPYITPKWYCDMFDIDPNSTRHPVKEHGTNGAMLRIKSNFTFFFMTSNEFPKMSFTSVKGRNYAVTLFKAKEIDEIYKRMKDKKVDIISDDMAERDERCERFSFYDPDGRMIEITNGT